jgi:hypothetical protein
MVARRCFENFRWSIDAIKARDTAYARSRVPPAMPISVNDHRVFLEGRAVVRQHPHDRVATVDADAKNSDVALRNVTAGGLLGRCVASPGSTAAAARRQTKGPERAHVPSR